MKIIDISLSLDEQTLIYPGNIGLSVKPHQTIEKHSTHLSKIIMGSHTGTHIDAPLHAVKGGIALHEIPLDVFVGPCRVLDFTESSGSIKTDELKKKGVKAMERILAKTKNSLRGFQIFYDDYIYLEGSAADYLSELGIILFGIDYFSVKQRGSNDHRPHTSLLSKNIPIIEGIDLKEVSEGNYELVCLPLKFMGIEGAPARAILLEN